MKKTLSVLLAFTLIFSGVCVFAENGIEGNYIPSSSFLSQVIEAIDNKDWDAFGNMSDYLVDAKETKTPGEYQKQLWYR